MLTAAAAATTATVLVEGQLLSRFTLRDLRCFPINGFTCGQVVIERVLRLLIKRIKGLICNPLTACAFDLHVPSIEIAIKKRGTSLPPILPTIAGFNPDQRLLKISTLASGRR